MAKQKFATKKELAHYRAVLKTIPENVQNHRVLAYLLKYKTLSQFEAYDNLNIVNLPARIYELRKDYEIPIDKMRIHNPGHKPYSAYYIGRPV